MAKFDQKSPPVRTEAAKRAQRLAEELRANLRKRKDKARSGSTEPQDGDPAEGPAGGRD